MAIFVAFSLGSPFFLTGYVWASVLTLSAELGIVAVVVTLLIIAGEFDLSVGSVFGMAAAIASHLMNSGWSPLAAMIGTLALCAVIGTVNGLLVTMLRIQSLIITIAGLMFYRAVALLVTNGEVISLTPPQVAGFSFLNSLWHGYSIEALWGLAVAGLLLIVLGKTQFGNWIYASGGDPGAAAATGVPVRRVKIALFVATAVAAGFAGILQMARLTSLDALSGTGLEIVVILATVVGGTSLFGGQGGVVGTVLGVLVLAMAQVGLVLVGIPAYWYQAGIGMFLVITVAGNTLLHRRKH